MLPPLPGVLVGDGWVVVLYICFGGDFRKEKTFTDKDLQADCVLTELRYSRDLIKDLPGRLAIGLEGWQGIDDDTIGSIIIALYTCSEHVVIVYIALASCQGRLYQFRRAMVIVTRRMANI